VFDCCAIANFDSCNSLKLSNKSGSQYQPFFANKLHGSGVACGLEPSGTNTLIPNFLSKFFVLLGFAPHVFNLTPTARIKTLCLPNLTLFDVMKYFQKRLLTICTIARSRNVHSRHFSLAVNAAELPKLRGRQCHRRVVDIVAEPL
jgi:hypothetical protein